MSLIVIKEPHTPPKDASCLNSGAWFIDHYGQIFITALDDRLNEYRVICVGDFCKPFIPNIELSHIEVSRILLPGTTLQITSSVQSKGGR